MVEKRKGLNAFTLKITMTVLMLLDHLYYFLPYAGFPVWFTMFGRLVAPAFCYLMTQSLYFTKDRKRYILRLTLAGFVMLTGNFIVAMLAQRLNGGSFVFISNSIFLSLTISAALIDNIEKLCQNGFCVKSAVISLALIFACQYVEGAFLLPIFAIIFYFLHGNRLLMSAAYLLGGTLTVYLMTGLTGTSLDYTFVLCGLRLNIQYLQAFALIPILLYSGNPGPRNAFSKWFFYIFYPLHIWIIYLISQI